MMTQLAPPAAPDVVEVTKRPVNRVVYTGLRALTRTLGRRWQLTIEGIEHLPGQGPAILAANHVSFLDSPLLMFSLPRRVWFLGKAEYLDSTVSRLLFPALGMIPVDRGGGRGALAALRNGLGVLGAGHCLGIYPEGTRSRDGNLHRGHTGLAWLAIKSGSPIVPIGISGTDQVQPAGRTMPRLRGDCTIRIGEPVAVDHYRSGDRRTHRLLTDDVMFEICQLSGQTYVDRYAETARR